jgi:hypothetical protein
MNFNLTIEKNAAMNLENNLGIQLTKKGYETDRTLYKQGMYRQNSSTSIDRQPISSTGFSSTPNNQNRPLSRPMSESNSETETGQVTMVNPVDSGGEAVSRDDSKSVAGAPPEGWPTSPLTLPQRDLGKRLEICTYVFMAVVCFYFLSKKPRRMPIYSISNLLSICVSMRRYV